MSGLLRFPNINNITISGRLTRDVEVKYSTTNQPIARVSIAVSHFYKDEKSGEFKEQASFVDAVAFGEIAKKCSREIKKGSPIIIEGYLKTRSYIDQNNQNRKVTEINISKLYVLEKQDNLENSYHSNHDNTVKFQPSEPRQTTQFNSENQYSAPSSQDEEPFENDVPF